MSNGNMKVIMNGGMKLMGAEMEVLYFKASIYMK
jgi:hypothetical protein